LLHPEHEEDNWLHVLFLYKQLIMIDVGQILQPFFKQLTDFVLLKKDFSNCASAENSLQTLKRK
jgi:hypothetical protein